MHIVIAYLLCNETFTASTSDRRPTSSYWTRTKRTRRDLWANRTATIQAIELGKLNLSEELALKISVETGVSARWLLDGDPNVEPVMDDGGSGIHLGIFTKNDFEERRADRLQQRRPQV